MSLTSSLLSRVLQGGSCTREELIALSREPLEELCQAANAIREHFCGNVFDLCTIINGRSGKCSENCKYCAQSAHYSTAVEEYPLLSDEALLAGARYNDERGILRYSIVTSGKRLTDADVDRLCASYEALAGIIEALIADGYSIIPISQMILPGDTSIDPNGRQCPATVGEGA